MTAHSIFKLYENAAEQELIYVLKEDRDGYIHYWYCDDPTQQEYSMSKVELYRDYERMLS